MRKNELPFIMKRENNIKTRITMFLFAIICLLSSITPAFASGWPGGSYDGETSNYGEIETLSPTGDVSAIDEKQEDIAEYGWEEKNDISATIDYGQVGADEGDTMAANIYSGYSDMLPVVDIDDLISWSNKKGFEIIKFLQTFIQPFAIIIFMVSSIMILVGSIGNQQLAGKGFAGLICSVLSYAGCLYASSILSTLVSWLGS